MAPSVVAGGSPLSHLLWEEEEGGEERKGGAFFLGIRRDFSKTGVEGMGEKCGFGTASTGGRPGEHSRGTRGFL